MTEKTTPEFRTLTDRVRFYTSGVTTRLGQKGYELGIHPDVVTLLGLIVVAVASYVAAQGHFFWSAIILILGTPLDALDGAIARAMKRKDKFGALLNSTLDRFADGYIFAGLAYYYSTVNNHNAVLLSILASLGTFLVSYVRARAEGLDIDCKVGLLTRMERTVIILAMLLTGWVIVGLWILAIGTHVTVIQRVWHVRRVMQQQGGGV